MFVSKHIARGELRTRNYRSPLSVCSLSPFTWEPCARMSVAPELRLEVHMPTLHPSAAVPAYFPKIYYRHSLSAKSLSFGAKDQS